MNDVLDRLAALRSPALSVDAGTVAADVRRGRRALHRRRTVRGGALAVCALAVAGVAGTTLRDPASHVHQPAGLRLVDYTGEQQPGFTIDKVPAGFELQGVTASNLNVVRPGDTSSINSFVGKIVVMLEWNGDQARQEGASPAPDPMEAPDGARLIEREPDLKRFKITFDDGHVEYRDMPTYAASPAPEPPAVEPFDVDGGAAKIDVNDEGTHTLRYSHGDYTLAIQVWPTLGLTDAQLREFADGVSVTADAQAGRG